MRLLQLVTGPDELLDLHPHVTVVQHLDGPTHDLLVDTVAGLVRGHPNEATGLLEAHGVLFDLDPSLLDLLELNVDDLDLVIHPEDLPTHPITDEAVELRAREESFAELLTRVAEQAKRQARVRAAATLAATAIRDARAERASAEEDAARGAEQLHAREADLARLAERYRAARQELANLRSSLEAARSARAEAEHRTAGVRAAATAAVARHEGLRDELAGPLEGTDPAAAVESATIALQEAEAAAAALECPADADPPQRPPVDLAELTARAEVLDLLLVALEPVDADGVADALARLRDERGGAEVPSPEGQTLADEIEALEAELRNSDVEDVDLETVESARARLGNARHALLEAEDATHHRAPGPTAVAELEEIHARLLEAMDKADGRFAGARGQRRVALARAEEQFALERLGFESYTDFVMGHSVPRVDAEQRAALDAARDELAAAEADWARIEPITEAALAKEAVLDRRRAALGQAAELLGETVADGPSAARALRALRVPVPTSAGEATNSLRRSLEAVGVDLGDEPLDGEELGMVADAWLAEASRLEERRRTILEERVALQEVLAGRPDATQADSGAGHRHAERIAEARAALREAEARLHERRAEEERRAVLETARHEAESAARAAVEAARSAEQEVAAAVEREAPLAARAEELTAELAEIDEAGAAAQAAVQHLKDEAPVDLDELERRIEAAEDAHKDALARLAKADNALAALEAARDAAAPEIARLRRVVAVQPRGPSASAEQLEWYFLARLAAQRSVSIAGSLPLLVDDALRELDPENVDRVLGRLERMADAVQVIIVSDDPVVAAWAEQVGPLRAAVVSPGAA